MKYSVYIYTYGCMYIYVYIRYVIYDIARLCKKCNIYNSWKIRNMKIVKKETILNKCHVLNKTPKTTAQWNFTAISVEQFFINHFYVLSLQKKKQKPQISTCQMKRPSAVT